MKRGWNKLKDLVSVIAPALVPISARQELSGKRSLKKERV